MSIYLIGDIHQRIEPIKDFYKRNKDDINKEPHNTLILLGDAGLNYWLDERDRKFKEELGKYPFTYFVIRGNHEQRPSLLYNRDEWDMYTFFDGAVMVEREFPYIKYAADSGGLYSIPCGLDYYKGSAAYAFEDRGYKTKFLKTLVLPGAYSVDKYYILSSGKGKWFEQEQMSSLEMIDISCQLNALYNNRVDLILSHTCPQVYEPTDLFIGVVDQTTVDKSMELFFNDIMRKCKYKAWVWAHYHEYREYSREKISPTYDEPRMLMLYNDGAVSLHNIMYDNCIFKL